MSTRPRLTKLPHLLSTLPQNGRYALVRPSSYPTDSYYFITRTKLRFAPIPINTTAESGEKGKGKEKEREVINPVEAGGLKAHGRAWGMFFRKGEYLPPQTRSSNPDPLIRGGLKHPWQSVDPASLPAEAQEAVKAWKDSYRDSVEAKERLLEGRKERSETLSEERRVEYEKGNERRARAREESLKVQILY